MLKFKNKEEFAETKGFNSDLVTYIVTGGNTYSIKDTLKELGCIFCQPLGWHSTKEIEVPEGYKLIPVSFDDIYEWSQYSCWGTVKEGAEEKLKKLIYPPKEAPEEFRNSDYFGSIGERLRNLTATLVSSRGFEGSYGYSYCHTFLSGGNVLIWFTSAKSLDEFVKGGTVILSGTVKKYDNYNGVKQTILSRCIVKPVE